MSALVAVLAVCLLADPGPIEAAPEPAPVERVEPAARGGLRDLGTYKITAYALRGRTRSGVPAGPGVCAADPRILPLGTEIEVEDVGRCTVLDTGSAVIGRHVDVWMSDYSDAMQWGVRAKQVSVLDGE